MVRTSSSSGRNDQALVSMSTSERVRFGPGQDHTQRDPTAHRMAEQVDRPLGHLFNEADQVGGQLINGVAGDVMGLGREPVAARIQRDDTPRLGQSLDLQREIMGGPGEAVAEHQGRPLRAPHWPQCNSTPLTLMRSGPLTESDSVRVRHAQVVVLGDDDLARVADRPGRPGRERTLKVRNDCSRAS